jgi:hypothetical protein
VVPGVVCLHVQGGICRQRQDFSFEITPRTIVLDSRQAQQGWRSVSIMTSFPLLERAVCWEGAGSRSSIPSAWCPDSAYCTNMPRLFAAERSLQVSINTTSMVPDSRATCCRFTRRGNGKFTRGAWRSYPEPWHHASLRVSIYDLTGQATDNKRGGRSPPCH